MLERLATSPDWYAQLSLDGLARAKEFSPALHVEKMAGVLAAALGET
jgi:hypothetical protein